MSYAPACGQPWRMKRMLSWEVAGTEVDRSSWCSEPGNELDRGYFEHP
jgi:hypothetical protein